MKRQDQDRVLWAVSSQIGNVAEFATDMDLGDIDRTELLTLLDNAMKRACGNHTDFRVPQQSVKRSV